jgi:pimeloyl-ACP methyl ester carboxylesterase
MTSSNDGKHTPGKIGRRTFSKMAALGTAAAALPGGAWAAPAARVRNAVLVHGAYADGSCWSDVISRLQGAGMNVTAVQHPLTTLQAGVEATARALALQDGPAVLVGHSFGGTIVTQAGVDPKAVALVYIAARAPDAGEDYPALAKTYPPPPASAGLVKSQGYAKLGEAAFLRDFANGVDPARARVLYATQGPISDQLFTAKTTQAAWRTKPSWYAISKQDRTIDPGLQRFMAKRMKATAVELDAGHLSLISHSREVAELILAAAHGPE